MATTIEEVAAHEAGHCVMALAMGVTVKGISAVNGSHPGSQLDSPDMTFASEFIVETMYCLEARLTYLIAVGGFAGETILHGAIEPRGALDDLSRLRGVGLTDFHIQGFTGIAIDVLNENISVWNEIRAAAIQGIKTVNVFAVEGLAMHKLFNQTGKRFTDFHKLEEVLPISDM
jgi:hypothetical protein